MQTLANIFAVVMLVITVSSAIAAITDTPKSDGWWRKIYYVIDFCALNVGKAKQKQGRLGTWMKQLYKDGIVPEQIYNSFVFYKKAFWICFAYLLWDMFRVFGWL